MGSYKDDFSICLHNRKINNMKKILGILLCTISLSCFSTNYREVRYEILRPAYYTLPSNIDSLLIVSCVDNPLVIDEYLINLPDSQLIKALKVKRSMPAIICNVMLNEINASDYLKIKIQPQTIPWQKLRQMPDSICKESGADAILALTRFDYEAKVEVINEPSYTDEDLANVSYGRLNNVATSYIRPYSTTQTQFMLLMPNRQSRHLDLRCDTMQYDPYWQTLGDTTIYRQVELYYATAENVGQCMASMFYPAWEYETRTLVVTDSKNMLDAYKWTLRKEWEEAKNLWMQAVEQGSTADKISSMINIAIYYDRLDNVQEAAMWYSKSLDLIESTPSKDEFLQEKYFAEKYFEAAIYRMQEQDILDKQMRMEE